MKATGVNMEPTTQPTIRAVNKKTGQVFEGTIDEARKFGFSDEFIASKLETNKKIAELTNPSTASVGTDTQKFNQKQALESVLQAENFFSPGTEKTLALANDATRQSKAKAGGQALIKSFTDPDYQQRLNEFKGQMNLVVGALTQLSGSGAPQADEAKRLLAAAPNETSTDAEAQAWFKSVKALGGFQEQQTQTEAPQVTTASESQPQGQDTVLGRASTGNVILDLLKGFVDPALTNIRNYAQDVGAGAGQKLTEGMTQEGNQNVMDMSQKLYEKAKTVTDPEEKKRLLKLAGQNLDVVSQNSSQAANQYSEDIGQNYAKRGVDVASSIVTLADLFGGATKLATKGVNNPFVKTLTENRSVSALQPAEQALNEVTSKAVSKIGNVLKLGSKDKEILNEGINLMQEGINKRETLLKAAEAGGKTINGTRTAEDMFKWADNAIASGEDPKKVQKLLNEAINIFDGKEISPSKAKELWDAADTGFTTAGDPGRTLISKYQMALRDSLRKEFENIAPGFEEATNMISQGIEKSELLKSVSDSITKTNVKNQLKGPLKRILSSTPVKIGAGVYGGEKLRTVLTGQ